MREYHSLGHMRGHSPEELEINPIIGPKLHVVFDGSFKDAHNDSLTDKLYIDPPIRRNLFAVCFRFRLHKFVFSADTVKMFRKIWVAEKHLKFSTYSLRENLVNILKHFQLCTVTYDTFSAPYPFVRVFEQLAKDDQQTHPNASRILCEDFYVDDVLTGAAA